jgi:hypothetical protein
MTKYHYLRDLGWGFAPIFFGQQEPSVPGSHILTAEQGILDGRQAIKLAHQAGVPQGSVIFLDIETGGNLSSDFLDYYRAWIKEIFSNNFRPGVYCDFLKTADQLLSVDNRVVFWVFNTNNYSCLRDGHFPYPEPNPSESGVAYASVWQLIQRCSIGSDGRTIPSEVDLDSATNPDPSHIRVLAFTARLAGSNEVPFMITGSTGVVKFQLASDNNSLIYSIDLRNIKGVLSANLYQKNGSILAQLFNPYLIHTPTGPINGVFLQGNLTSNDLYGSLTGKLSRLVNLMMSGQVYVNIRTQQHQTGEIRGQISPAS